MVSVLIMAAGRSARMGDIDKLFYELEGRPVLSYSISAFQSLYFVSEIVVVCRPEKREYIREMCRKYALDKVQNVVSGGDTRTESVERGLVALKNPEYVAIHDAARPFVTQSLVSTTYAAALKSGAAAPGIRVKDTIKRVNGDFITDTLPRDALRAIQTPQIFSASELLTAYHRLSGWEFTDDCAVMEAAGARVTVTEGDEDNFKITTPTDLERAKAVLERRKHNAEIE